MISGFFICPSWAVLRYRDRFSSNGPRRFLAGCTGNVRGNGVLYCLAPSLVYCGFFQRHTEIAGFLEGSNQGNKIAAIRLESWLARGHGAFKIQ
jgi:hypothetical protein